MRHRRIFISYSHRDTNQWDTKIWQDRHATHEEWLDLEDGTSLKLLLRSTFESMGNRFYFSLYNDAGKLLPGVQVYYGGQEYTHDPAKGRDEVEVPASADEDIFNFKLFQDSKLLSSLRIKIEQNASREIISDTIKIHEAWKMASALRTCPPDRILFDENPDHHLVSHTGNCSFCQERLKMSDLDAWQVLGQNLAEFLPKPVKKEVAIGQVWSITEGFGGWTDNHLYYRPPVVAVLEQDARTGEILVSQICSENQMAGSNDVTLGEQFGFAEPWNRYVLKPDHLELCWGEITSDVVQKIKEASDSKDEIDRESVRFLFREMEIDIGKHFALKSATMETDVAPSNDRQESAPVPAVESWTAMSKEELKAELHELVPGITFQITETNASAMLAALRFPDEYLPMAAADDNRDIVYAKLLTVKVGRIDGLEPLKADALFEYQKDTLAVDIFFPEFPADSKKSSVNCLYILKDNRKVIAPCKEHWNPSDHSFHADFRISGESEGNLEVAVIVEV